MYHCVAIEYLRNDHVSQLSKPALLRRRVAPISGTDCQTHAVNCGDINITSTEQTIPIKNTLQESRQIN